jgi:hypothetical protein
MGINHVHGKTTSSNGCKVEIDGDVIYSLIPPLLVFAVQCTSAAHQIVRMETCILELKQTAELH